MLFSAFSAPLRENNLKIDNITKKNRGISRRGAENAEYFSLLLIHIIYKVYNCLLFADGLFFFYH